MDCPSRPARGEWIEIAKQLSPFHTPMSRPARGEWIEISMRLYASRAARSRPARGEWIEMPDMYWRFNNRSRLAPRGASGLK